MVEKIIGIIDTVFPYFMFNWRELFGGMDNIIFTNKRMIFAQAVGVLDEYLHVTWWPEGSYFWLKKIIKICETEAEKMKNSNPDDILNSNKHNFQISYDKVIRIEMTHSTRGGSTIKIFTTDNKTYRYNLWHTISDSDSIKDRLVRFWLHESISKEIFDNYAKIVSLAVHDKLSILLR